MTTNVGIDISGVQPVDVPGDWLFIVVKLSEGLSVTNPSADAQWAAAARAPFRGLYHYARPDLSDGATQAEFFAQQALSRGFKPNVDIWQLDVEGMLNSDVRGPEWLDFIERFMAKARQLLGGIGFLYVGRWFFPNELSIEHDRWPWWLPDYGANDGEIHQLPAGVNPVIHQFSSHNGLDKNVIHDAARWSALTGTSGPNPVVQIPTTSPGDEDEMIFTDKVNVPKPQRKREAKVTATGDILLLGGAKIAVGDVVVKPVIKKPYPPFLPANYPAGEHFLGSTEDGANGFILTSLLPNGEVAVRGYQFVA